LIAYFIYGKFLTQKVFKLDDTKITPAVEINDGQDFVPAKKGFLLGQHFSAIAAAGPINGPILASVMFGWGPAIIWCLVGAIFIGGVHDMGSIIASVRNKAKSITEVIRQNVSRRAWLLFMVFIWITLVYVIIAFTDITASSFVGNVMLENGDSVLGGGIASSSVMYLILPIIMGLLMRKTGLTEGKATLIFLPLVGVAIWLGQYIPLYLPIGDIAMQQKLWGVLILGYCVIASMVPMWLLLQPRGALGGYFLYAVLLVAAIGLIFGGFQIEYPAFISATTESASPLFPILFITIACGACSGFHSLVSSGTTSKQLTIESHAKHIGYGGMLLEGMLACVSIACVMIIAVDSEMLTKAPNFIYAQGIGRFMELIGIPAAFGISFGLMAFTTFVYDTLDVCTRLGRYIVEELTGIKGLKGSIIGTLLTAGVPIFFIFQTMTDASGNVIPAWRLFWNTFGASNQLLAALALIGISIWLKKESSKPFIWLVAFLPALWMFAMSIWSLLLAIYNGWVLNTGHFVIPIVSVVLIILALLVSIETVIAMLPKRKNSVVS
jgi:carbon starvation protein